MRLNKIIAQVTGMGRRTVDRAIADGRVRINNQIAHLGQIVNDQDIIALDGEKISVTNSPQLVSIILNKPVGYVVSRNGQGSRTIYDLLLPAYQRLKPVGRLDKDSSGLLLLTNNGQLANELTHPSSRKQKIYEVTLDKPLTLAHQRTIMKQGVALEDGPSKFELKNAQDPNDKHWQVIMSEGRNRQIRRTFAALGYSVSRLHRIQFGEYSLGNLASAESRRISDQ